MLYLKKLKSFYILDKIYHSNLKMKQFTIEEINEILKGTIVGNITTKITAPEQLEVANETEISFIGNKKYEKLWAASKACVAVVNEDIAIEP